VYVDGERFITLQGATIVPDFFRILNEYIESRYSSREGQPELVPFQV